MPTYWRNTSTLSAKADGNILVGTFLTNRFVTMDDIMLPEFH
jgi:hypothetical protein